MHTSKMEFWTSERITRIVHEVKEERFRREGEASAQGKVGHFWAGLLEPALRGLTTQKPQEQCC